MNAPPDLAERVRALTDLDTTLFVEAAAGTGKTALMAGRLVMLLARGTPPHAIAAITFTELAASALSRRVHDYVNELLAERVPEPLQPALPKGLNAAQQAALTGAASQLDELTCTTIHAFCQNLITSYAVEADVDPGARILDSTGAESAFDTVFDQWFKRRLSGEDDTGDAVVTLSRNDPRHVVTTLRDLARFRLQHRSARPRAPDLSGRPDIDLTEAVTTFRRWLATQPREPKTVALADDLEQLALYYAGSFATPPNFATLWKLARPPQLACMRKKSVELVAPRTRGAWNKAAGDAGDRLYDETVRHFDAVDRTYRLLLGRLAAALVSRLSDELDEVLADYDAFKRAAAMLDFDDLLTCAQRLVREHEPVRVALGVRYRHIFVDEFQDTDPVQAEVLFRIAADVLAPRWQDNVLRAGALFLVGDPKQSIYRFRGADVICYGEARDAIVRRWPDAIVRITANFRSRPGIIDHVNRCFEVPLSLPGQPSYVALTATLDEPSEPRLSVARIAVDLPPDTAPEQIRDAEAQAVAELCGRLIGRLKVRREGGASTSLTPSDISLLAPTGRELWRYEHALEAQGLPVASQAGKGLFRRQETQDVIALVRTLADARDTLALGALLRGPLVGLTDEELLDIAVALPASDGAATPPRLSLRTPLDQITHPLAHWILSNLQDLRRQAWTTTPALLLAEAIERLLVRPILAARGGDRGARASANVDALLERARSYDVAGLKRFARDLTRDWRANVSCDEGRIDAEDNAIQIHTIHSAKGLEWPVVIPINAATELPPRKPFIHRQSDDTLHWVIGNVVPPDLSAALEEEEIQLSHERTRLWYVACTRARDLLAVPQMTVAKPNSWARVVDLAHGALTGLVHPQVTHAAPSATTDQPNIQTADRFKEERAIIESVAVPIAWLHPSDHDDDRLPVVEPTAISPDDLSGRAAPVGGGRVRGLVLHKIMEEVLTGELTEGDDSLIARARTLMSELAADLNSDMVSPSVEEIAATVKRTLKLPEIAALRPRLIPEWPTYGVLANRPTPTALAGRIDAIVYEQNQPIVVVDWKSDVHPSETDIRRHARQLEDYLLCSGATRGALVYMTSGFVHWINKDPAP